MSIIDHVGYAVGDVEASATFYDAALAPLGITRMADIAHPGGRVLGYGAEDPQFWINSGDALRDRVHVAFAAATRARVDAFYRAAIAAGGRDNGEPGLRPQYHENYYAAFVLDPDGHNIEAVCHVPA